MDEWGKGKATYEFIEIINIPRTPGKLRITEVWDVVEKRDDGFAKIVLGSIRWEHRQRGYVFYPEKDTTLDPGSLTNIAEFCKEATARYRTKGRPK
jgi:hypothetical protein